MITETVFFWMAVSPACILTLLLIIGDFDIEFDVMHGDFNIGESHGVGPLGMKLILSFTSGFGLGGYLAYYFDWGIHPILSGLLFAIPVYSIVFLGMRFLYSQRANTLINSKNVIGQTARVVHQIPSNGVGEIVAEDPTVGRSIYLPAVGTQAIGKDSIVIVDSIEGGTARVSLKNN